MAAAVAAAGLVLAASASTASTPKWRAAADVQLALSDAQAALVLGSATAADAHLDVARSGAQVVLADHPAALRSALRVLARVDAGDERALATARSAVWATILATSFSEATRATARGDAAGARSWLLVREFRPPTRFSRAAADATVALDLLEEGSLTPAAAAAAVRRDLLDTYDARLRTTLSELREADSLGYGSTRSELATLALGYWRILAPVHRRQHGSADTAALTASFEWIATEAAVGPIPLAVLDRVEDDLAGFRAAPLSKEELVRRAGQVERFLRLVPIEYGRGVKDGHVTLDFEIQEAVTFRDGAESAFHDVEPVLTARDMAATRRLAAALEELDTALSDASRGTAVAPAEDVATTTERALGLIGVLYPDSWKKAAETADFDVISTTLDRLQAAAAAGDWKQAESARLEAYGVFELGPEQRLRGLAPALFQEVEGYFWYGTTGFDGLVQLLGRRAQADEIASTRAALDDALARSERQIGSGSQSEISAITNSAIIVFREGLEAVLILAALMASLVGGQRHFRKPIFAGVALALVASAITWIVAQTLLTSLAAYGEKLEAVVSLVAIAVLLLILNWFYHRVYWQENLQTLHKRKRRVIAGAGISIAAAQVVGLVLLGFSSVYREGFETVLFLQAMTLEVGPVTVLEGVALGLAAVTAVFVLVIALERRLPHKKMLIATGILITWVLVMMVGTTVQTMQKVGWIGVTPVEGVELPYWAGLWLGIFPTWEGLIAQTAAATFVVGSYFAAEALRRRRREARFTTSPSAPDEPAYALEPADVVPGGGHVAEPVGTR